MQLIAGSMVPAMDEVGRLAGRYEERDETAETTHDCLRAEIDDTRGNRR